MLRIAKSLLTIASVAAIATGATSAAWTDSTTVPNNVFSTGVMNIDTAPTTTVFTAPNIYPGWSEEQTIDVQNNGSVQLNYTAVASQTAGNAELYTAPEFLLKIGTISGGNDVYDGTVSGLAFANRLLLSGASEMLYFTVSLDGSADNSLQGKTATVTFTFNATQP